MRVVILKIQGQIKREMDFTIADFQGLAGNNDRTLGWMFLMDYVCIFRKLEISYVHIKQVYKCKKILDCEIIRVTINLKKGASLTGCYK